MPTAKAMIDRQQHEPPPHLEERDDRIANDHFVFWGCNNRECALTHSRKPLPAATVIRSNDGIIEWLKRLWRDR